MTSKTSQRIRFISTRRKSCSWNSF